MDNSLAEESLEFEIISDENQINLCSLQEHQDSSFDKSFLCSHGLMIRTLFKYNTSESDPNKG